MNTQQQITINNKSYQVRFSMRAIKLFEEMTGKSIKDVTGVWDNLQYCYYTIKALNEDFDMTLEQFIDLLDENPQLLIDLTYSVAEKSNEVPDIEITEVSKKRELIKIFSSLWMLSVLLLLSPIIIPVIFGCMWILEKGKTLYHIIVNSGSKRA